MINMARPRKMKLILIDTDYRRGKNIVFKGNINNDGEALNAFREIFQTYWGIPDEETLKKFLTPIGFEKDKEVKYAKRSR